MGVTIQFESHRVELAGVYEMEHDGFSLDDKRQPIPENDTPDILSCWNNRRDPVFQTERDQLLIGDSHLWLLFLFQC